MRVALQRFRLTVRVEMVHLAPLTRINLLWLNVSQAIGLLVNAAVGREPSEQATLRGHCAADRLAVHASRVGELPTERISVSREAGVGKVSEGRVGGRPWGSPEEQKLAVPWPVEAPGTANPTDNCVQRWSGVFYRSGRKPIMEIPGEAVKFPFGVSYEDMEVDSSLCTHR